jgi:hypothetical protein
MRKPPITSAELDRLAARDYFPPPEKIDAELPTYIDEQGRTIKVCPKRWAHGVQFQSQARPTSRRKHLSP